MNKRYDNAAAAAEVSSRNRKTKQVDTDDDNMTTDDDLDETDVSPNRRVSTNLQSAPIAPITINVKDASNDDTQMAKASRNNVHGLNSSNILAARYTEGNSNIANDDEEEENNNSNNDDEESPRRHRFRTNEENPQSPPKIKVQMDRRLIELLKLPIKDFVMLPVPAGLTICTRVIRDKSTFSKGIYPVYHMYIDMYEGVIEQSLLLVARRRQKSKKICYLVGVEKKHTDDSLVGKVKSNLVGTRFNCYDNGTNPKKSKENRRTELAHIMYELNPMGFNGPRKFSVVMPSVDQNTGQRNEIRPLNSSETLSKKYKQKDFSSIIYLQNKEPEWNEELRTFQLDFKQRVNQVSVKNFQLVHPENTDIVLLQSGRVGENDFTCDFTFPFSPLQAFGIALSSITEKIACA